MPDFSGRFPSRSMKASNPPADAPTPTIGKGLYGFAVSSGSGAAAVDLSPSGAPSWSGFLLSMTVRAAGRQSSTQESSTQESSTQESSTQESSTQESATQESLTQAPSNA